MKQYKFNIGGVNYEVEVANFDGQNITVSVNGTPYEVTLESKVQAPKTPIITRRTNSTAPSAAPAATTPAISQTPKSVNNGSVHKIDSPLPGSIMRLNVAVGDTVKTGQCLLVMEAMKMENNVMADKDGVVQAIKIKVGDTVLQGDVLMELA